jgi:hypothetical protein
VDDLKKKEKKANCAKLLNAQVVDAPEFFPDSIFLVKYKLCAWQMKKKKTDL